MKSSRALVWLLVTSCAAREVRPTAPRSDTTTSSHREMIDAEFRRAPPEVAPLQAFVPPAPDEVTLADGIRVVMLQDERSTSVVLGLMLPGDIVSGARAVATTWLAHGLIEHGRVAIVKGYVDPRGFEADHLLAVSDAGSYHHLGLSGRAPSFELPALVHLLAERTLRPEIAQAPLDWWRKRLEQALFVTHEAPARISDRSMGALLGLIAAPFPDDDAIRAVTLENVATAHKAMLNPGQMSIVATGSFDRVQLLELLNEWFGPLPRVTGAASAPRTAATARPSGKYATLRATVVDSPTRSEVTISFGAKATGGAKAHSEVAVSVANALLHRRAANAFRGRAFGSGGAGPENVYVEKVGDDLRLTGSLTIPINELGARLDALASATKALGGASVSDQEIASSRNVAFSWLADSYSTADGAQKWLWRLVDRGLPLTAGGDVVRSLTAVSSSEVAELLRAVSDPTALRFGFVGDAGRILPILREHGFGDSVEVIKQESSLGVPSKGGSDS